VPVCTGVLYPSEEGCLHSRKKMGWWPREKDHLRPSVEVAFCLDTVCPALHVKGHGVRVSSASSQRAEFALLCLKFCLPPNGLI
jgi:hypothetical protein